MGKCAVAVLGGVFGTVSSAGNGSVAKNLTRTDTASTAASSANSADTVASTASGARMTVSLTALTGGTSPTIAFALWDSADNSTFAAVPGATIAAMNATGTQTVSVNGGTPVRRFVAVATTITGAPTGATFTATVDKLSTGFTPHQNPDHTAVKDTRT